MPDYGPKHECYGCPFVQPEKWKDPISGEISDIFACRGSKVLDYQTDAYCCDSKGAALHVRTLDLEFIQAFFNDYLALPGHDYEHLCHGMDSPENGRWPYSFGFTANKQGEADRKALIDRYFRSEGKQPGALPSECDKLVRKDVTPEQEKEIVLNQIKGAKAMAQGKAEEASAEAKKGMTYIHGDWRYFADKRDDNGKFTVFMISTADSVIAGQKIEASTIPDFDTFEEAQNALDGYALKRKFIAEYPDGSEDALGPERAEDDPEDLGPDGMEELAEDQEPGRTDEMPEAEGTRAMRKMILPNGSENRRLVLKAVQENMPCQAVHICDEQPDNVKIWLNEVESHEGPDSEFWVINRDGEAGGEQIDRCPYCGAGLKWGAGDVAIMNDAPESDGNEVDSGNDADGTPNPEDNSGDSANDQPEEQQGPCDWQNASGDDEKEPEDEESDEVSGDPLSLRGPEFNVVIATADTVLNRLVAMLHAKKQRDGEMTVKVTFEDANGAGSYIFSGAVSGKINYTVKPQKIVGDAVELQFDAQGNPIVPADREHQISFDEIQPGQREYPPQGGTATVDGKTGIVEHYEGKEDEPADPPASDDAANSVTADDPEGGEPDSAQDAASGETDEPYPCKNIDCPFYGASDSGDPGCCYKTGEEPDPFDADSAVEQENCTRPEILQAYADGHPDESEENIELDEKKG
jgi:hypothetical protein